MILIWSCVQRQSGPGKDTPPPYIHITAMQAEPGKVICQGLLRTAARGSGHTCLSTWSLMTAAVGHGFHLLPEVGQFYARKKALDCISVFFLSLAFTGFCPLMSPAPGPRVCIAHICMYECECKHACVSSCVKV